MNLPAHFMASEVDGALVDLRAPSGADRVRANYRQTHRAITCAADVKATLRAGRYTFPGAYPLYFIAGDGEAMSFDAVRDNLAQVLAAVQSGDRRDCWSVIGTSINYEDPALYCAATAARIESAYAEDAAEDGAAESDGQPDEAQEYHDFNPDC